jgi:hypothetical protein
MKKIIVILIVFTLVLTTTTVFSDGTKLVDNNTLSMNKKISKSLLEQDKWMKTFGGFRLEVGSSVQLTSDGGYIIVGLTKTYGAGKEDIWVIKTDITGNMTWNKTYGGKGIDFGNYIQQTTDGGYIIVGRTSSYGNGGDDIWLIKIDASGNKIWDKTFGYGIYDSGSEVRQTNDGGYIIVGERNNSGGGDSDLWVIKTDSDGNLVWDKTFDGEGTPISHDYGNSIALTLDGGYLVLGATFTSEDTANYDLWLINLNAVGETLWEKKIGGEDSEYGWSIQKTTDSGFIITGVDSYGTSQESLWLIKTDSSGTVVWNETYSGIGRARGSAVEQTADGGYIVAGYTYTESSYYDVLLIKTDDMGNLNWSKTYGGRYNDIAVSVIQTTDGGYILTGEKGGLLHDEDVWLIKTNANGESKSTTSNGIPFIPFWMKLFERFPNAFPILRHLIGY